MNASNQISRFARIGSSIIKLGDSASDYEEQEYINKGSYLYRPYKIESVDAINSTNTINIDSNEGVLLQKGPIVINGQQYEWSYNNQEYYPVEIYHLDGSVYKNNGSRDILSRHYLDGLGGTPNRYTGAVYGKDGTKNWAIEPSSSLSSKAVQVKNTITGEIGEMSYSYGDMYLVDHPESNIVLNPNTKQFIVAQTLQPVSKPFVLAYKNRISSVTTVDISNIGNEGWIDDFTYNPEFSKPKILSSPIPESVEPKILKSPTNENAEVKIHSSPLEQELNTSKLGGFDLIQSKVSDYIYNADAEPHEVWGSDVPTDLQTILADGTFNRTKMTYLGARVYEKDKKYYYRDTKHGGKGAHLEVFDRKGNHIGIADPLTGVINKNGKVKGRKLNIK